MAIEVHALSKVYTQGGKLLYALKNISLNVEKGDVFGIIGLSGAGKSTLIRCLAGLVAPSEGSIYVNGKDLANLRKNDLRGFRQKVGMIFQHFNLLHSRTVAGNVAYPLEVAGYSKPLQEKRVEELLALVGLREKKNAYPSQLSGGEKQRVGIARALANHPEILLCDEATSSLDPKTTKEILDLLSEINRTLQVTVLLITHEMEVIKRICTKVAVIDKGEIVETEKIEKLFWHPQHPITKHFLQMHFRDLPEEFYLRIASGSRLVRLRFKGKSAEEPIISHLVKEYHIVANILLGWIDQLRTTIIGTLIIELKGSESDLKRALESLDGMDVDYEVLRHEL